ncbi:MAG: thioredoxin-dependent thiol peroxidase [Candidatus Zambryskibacteria bacterium]|nr:thioredoxin-dependent thiol peroxidase [Candidatus Zambryskibacteria bacterium]
MPLPKLNSKAPNFSLPDQDGKTHKLSDYKGKWVLLYFYPKDDTPGCTVEACTIRDQFQDFKKIKAIVLGVSKDSVESHRKFADTYDLPFVLLSDEDKKIIKKYGVWGEKNMAGKKYMGVRRTSFLIGPDGKIKKVYENVKPPKHASEVLSDLRTLNHP